MASKRNKADRDADRNVRYKVERNGQIASVVNNLIRWGGLVAIVYFIAHTLQSFSGQTTLAAISVKLLGSLRANDAAAWIFGAGGMGWGWRERRLRRNVNKNLGGRVAELEGVIDPKRTSSKLTQTGDTPPDERT